MTACRRRPNSSGSARTPTCGCRPSRTGSRGRSSATSRRRSSSRRSRRRSAPRCRRDCNACKNGVQSAIWHDERWMLRPLREPSGLPFVCLLETRAHLDFPDLDHQHAAELGPLLLRIQRAVASIPASATFTSDAGAKAPSTATSGPWRAPHAWSSCGARFSDLGRHPPAHAARGVGRERRARPQCASRLGHAPSLRCALRKSGTWYLWYQVPVLRTTFSGVIREHLRREDCVRRSRRAARRRRAAAAPRCRRAGPRRPTLPGRRS